jgi:hypothetical protein
MTLRNSSGFDDNQDQRNPKGVAGKKGSDAARRRKKGEPPKKRVYRQAKKDELFDYQPTGTASLPPAKEFIEAFVPRVLETIHGLREVRTLGRMVSQGVYNAIDARAASIKRRDQITKDPAPRPVFALGNIIVSEPRDGVCEAAAVVHGPTRVRAVAIRLEGLDNKWKATSFRML